jgi:exoribonuclease-2
MIQKSALVLYRQAAARVSETGDKLTVEYWNPQSGAAETQRVREKDVTLLHPGTATSLEKVLASGAAFAQKADAPRRVKEAYDLLAENAHAYPLEELAELAFGAFGAETAWGAYAAFRDSPYFAESAEGGAVFFAPRPAEEITRNADKAAAKKQGEASRAAFIARLRAKKLDLPADAQFMQEVEAVALGQSLKSRVMTDVGVFVSPEKAHQLLLDTGVWTNYRNPYPARRGLSARSAEERLSRPPEEARYEAPHTAFAVDNAWSADPDDAVSFDGEHLWVHIADPASTVLPDSSVDRAARNRGATLYLPEGAARMLAEESLEDYALGLSPVSRALSFRLALDGRGGVADCEVLKTLVRVKRYTYEEADALKDSAELAPLFRIAAENAARREREGAVTVDLPEVHIAVRDGRVSIEPVAHSEAAGMVREMMLLAGEGAARFAFTHGIPFPFVSQEAPELPEAVPEGLAGQFRLVKAMHARTVSTHPAPHAGLGLAFYSQVTSPLRRYGDLVAHQQLRAFIDGRKPLTRDEVTERLAAGDAAYGASVKAERSANLHWTLVYCLEHPEWRGDAVVVDAKGSQATVLIPSLARQETLAAPRKAALNDVFRVKAGKISLPELRIGFVKA